jgi:hypothetical protein
VQERKVSCHKFMVAGVWGLMLRVYGVACSGGRHLRARARERERERDLRHFDSIEWGETCATLTHSMPHLIKAASMPWRWTGPSRALPLNQHTHTHTHTVHHPLRICPKRQRICVNKAMRL